MSLNLSHVTFRERLKLTHYSTSAQLADSSFSIWAIELLHLSGFSGWQQDQSAAGLLVLASVCISEPCQRQKYHDVWAAISGARVFKKSPASRNTAESWRQLTRPWTAATDLFQLTDDSRVDFSEVLPCYGRTFEAIANHQEASLDGRAACSWVKNQR